MTQFGLWIDTYSVTDNSRTGEQWRKVPFYTKLKKQSKAVMVMLRAMCLGLKTQWLIWQSVTPAGS